MAAAKKPLFVPSTADVETLISRASVILKAYICLLRDTGAEPYELGTLLFQDISVPDSTVTLTRKSQQRTMHISVETVNLVLALHHRRCKRDYVFEDVLGILREFEGLKAAMAHDDSRFASVELESVRRRACLELNKKTSIDGIAALLGVAVDEAERLVAVCPACGYTGVVKQSLHIDKDGFRVRCWTCKCGARFYTKTGPGPNVSPVQLNLAAGGTA